MSPCPLILFDEINIKVKLLNFLICVVFSMIWSSLSYSNCAPYLTIILGLLAMITLAWLAVTQSNHIEQLGKALLHCLSINHLTILTNQTVAKDAQHYD